MMYVILVSKLRRKGGGTGLVQTNLLKGRIVASGMNRADIAKQLRMSPSTLSDKINGKRSFTVDEAEALCAILRISIPEEIVAIFLAEPSQN